MVPEVLWAKIACLSSHTKKTPVNFELTRREIGPHGHESWTGLKQSWIRLGPAESLYQRKVIAEAEFDRYRAASLSATAERQRAEQAVREAAVLLDYTVVRAPISGIVVDKRVEEGDAVVPGQVLLTLYDPTRMQMVVTVRESLAQRLAVGQSIRG